MCLILWRTRETNIVPRGKKGEICALLKEKRPFPAALSLLLGPIPREGGVLARGRRGRVPADDDEAVGLDREGIGHSPEGPDSGDDRVRRAEARIGRTRGRVSGDHELGGRGVEGIARGHEGTVREDGQGDYYRITYADGGRQDTRRSEARVQGSRRSEAKDRKVVRRTSGGGAPTRIFPSAWIARLCTLSVVMVPLPTFVTTLPPVPKLESKAPAEVKRTSPKAPSSEERVAVTPTTIFPSVWTARPATVSPKASILILMKPDVPKLVSRAPDDVTSAPRYSCSLRFRRWLPRGCFRRKGP